MKARKIRVLAGGGRCRNPRTSVALLPTPYSLLPTPYSLPLPRRQLAAIPGLGRLIRARVQRHLPLSIRLLLPNSNVSSLHRHWITARVLAVSLVVAPGVPHISRRPHHRVGRRPRQLIDLGIPVGGFLNRHLANQRSSRVAQRHAVLGKPIGKARSAPLQHVLGKTRLQIE